MTPKEKAADMIMRLCNLDGSSLIWNDAVKVAIEMVDNTINIYQNIAGEGPEKEVIYWNEVKREIELL